MYIYIRDILLVRRVSRKNNENSLRSFRAPFTRQQDREKEGEKFLLNDSLFFGIISNLAAPCIFFLFFLPFRCLFNLRKRNSIVEKNPLSRFFDS